MSDKFSLMLCNSEKSNFIICRNFSIAIIINAEFKSKLYFTTYHESRRKIFVIKIKEFLLISLLKYTFILNVYMKIFFLYHFKLNTILVIAEIFPSEMADDEVEC